MGVTSILCGGLLLFSAEEWEPCYFGSDAVVVIIVVANVSACLSCISRNLFGEMIFEVHYCSAGITWCVFVRWTVSIRSCLLCACYRHARKWLASGCPAFCTSFTALMATCWISSVTGLLFDQLAVYSVTCLHTHHFPRNWCRSVFFFTYLLTYFHRCLYIDTVNNVRRD